MVELVLKETRGSSSNSGKRSKLPIFILQLLSLCLVALGIVVLIGWHTKNSSLIQILPIYAPMKYNTALCFVAAGMSLILISLGRHRWAAPLGFLIFLTGTLTLSQYITGLNLGIDELFMRSYISVQTSHPGRISPIASIAFITLGSALISASLFHQKRWSTCVTGILGSVLIAMAAMAILSYSTGLTGIYSWGNFTRMALHTSFAFITAGLCLVTISWREEFFITRRWPRWLPITTSLIVLAATLSVRQAIVTNEENEIFYTLEANADTVKNEIESRLESRIRSLRRMAQRWEFSGKPDYANWKADALAYKRDYPGYQAIAWVDRDLRVQWIEPLENNEVALGRDMSGEERRRMAFEMARDQRLAQFTQPVELVQGGVGILASIPIFPERELDGFIVGIIRLREFLNATIHTEIALNYSMTIEDSEGAVFYERNTLAKPLSQKLILSVPIESHGTKWTMKIWPDNDLLIMHHTKNPEVILTLGVITALLLGLSMYLAQNAVLRSQQIAESNRELQFEIGERRRGELEIQKLGELQSAIVTHAAYAVISTTYNGVITTFNPAAEIMLGYSAAEVVGKKTADIFHDRKEVFLRTERLQRESEIALPWFAVFVRKAKQVAREHQEWTYIRKDGSRFPISLALSELKDSSGQVTGYLGIAEDITEFNRSAAELKKTHQDLLDASHKAGMAEVASSVLHNVGNVLNSVRISCAIVFEKVSYSRISSVAKTVELIEAHKDDLGAYLTNDPQGQKLPDFLSKLSTRLSAEQADVITEITLLDRNIDHITQIIAVQQRYAHMGTIQETVQITDLVEDALRMNSLSIARHHIDLVRKFDNVPPIPIEKHKVLQILVNLIRNAKHALTDGGKPEKRLTMKIFMKSPTCLILEVSDNGIGIAPENIARIFEHGFTTKKDGHGFGLHSGALAATEFGGSLSVSSDGPGTGATFTLEIPVLCNLDS